jgi:D-tagatose-1,6-bisphosphate aldolase subunit GatZ/KbaZ
MAEAAALVHACVAAGYTKLHLDASMRLGGDPASDGGPVDEELAVQRTAELCRVAEQAHASLPTGSPPPVYVIGTEVPVPGGETTTGAHPGDQTGAPCEPPDVTPPAAVQRTLDLTRVAFAETHIEDAWERVIAVVVQPGVEFGDQVVHDYDPRATAALSSFVAEQRPPGPAGHALVYEAHSTDYQTPAALARLVADHFAILKVGPALTFAVREALFALEAIERELLAHRHDFEPSRLRETLDAAMLADPVHWRAYYSGDADDQAFARAFSYSDRARYYWTDPQVRRAVARLLDTLEAAPIPPPLLSQYLPREHEALRVEAPWEATDDGASAVADLVRRHVLAVLGAYAEACGMRPPRAATAASPRSEASG